MKRTVLITGASSGIGLELAIVCARNGINLLLIARNGKALEKLSSEIIYKYNVQVDVLSIDLSVQSSAQEVYNWCSQKNIEVNYLINNAGFGDYGNFADSKWEKQLMMINLNIVTLSYLTHLFLPNMIKNNYGKILNVASTAAFQPGPGMSVYFATKAFVLHFSEAISCELNNTEVTVTALCPGPTESGFQDAANMAESKLVKGKKFPSSKEVAEYGYQSMMKGKTVAIHGTLNYILANSIRLVPRSLVLKMVKFMQDK
jgi:short-subunit dehydrogenase